MAEVKNVDWKINSTYLSRLHRSINDKKKVAQEIDEDITCMRIKDKLFRYDTRFFFIFLKETFEKCNLYLRLSSCSFEIH